MGFAMLNEDFLPRAPRGYAHQRFEALGCVEEVAARAAEDDRAAIEDDRILGEFEGEAGVLLDEEQCQVVFAPHAGETGQERGCR